MKLFTIKNLQRTIIILGVFFSVNLLVVIFFPNLYLDLGIADKDILDSQEKTWAFRGQVGDILAGHFTAISMLFIVFSLLLQHKSVEQMGESITQQSEAINQQSTAIQQQSEALINQQKEIKLQTDALTAQIKEMEAQKKEFETSNIQNRYNEYFRRLSSAIESMEHDGIVKPYYEDGIWDKAITDKNNFEKYKNDIERVLRHCNFIAKSIIDLDRDKDNMGREFALKLHDFDFGSLVTVLGRFLVLQVKHNDHAIRQDSWEALLIFMYGLVGERLEQVSSILYHECITYKHKEPGQLWQERMKQNNFVELMYPEIIHFSRML